MVWLYIAASLMCIGWFLVTQKNFSTADIVVFGIFWPLVLFVIGFSSLINSVGIWVDSKINAYTEPRKPNKRRTHARRITLPS